MTSNKAEKSPKAFITKLKSVGAAFDEQPVCERASERCVQGVHCSRSAQATFQSSSTHFDLFFRGFSIAQYILPLKLHL